MKPLDCRNVPAPRDAGRAVLARGLAFVLPIILAGCMVGPDFKPPADESPAQWIGSPPAAGMPADVGNVTTPGAASGNANSTAPGAGNATVTGNLTGNLSAGAPGPGNLAGNVSPAAYGTGNITGNGTPSLNGLFSDNMTQTTLVVPSPMTAVAWWTQFHDETLTGLIKDAAAQNLTVLQAQARIQQAEAAVSQVTGGFFPSASGSGAYTRLGSGYNPESNIYSTGLNGAWQLDIWGNIRRQVESAEASLQGAIEDRRNTLVTLLAEIGTIYTDLRTVQVRLRIAQVNLDAQERTLRVTQQRYQGGFVARLDVENAQAQADSTRSEIPSLETEQRQDIYQLGVLLGRDPGALVQELEQPGPMPRGPDSVPVGLPSDLLRRRADIRSAEANLHAATANIGVAISTLFPQFALTGQLGFQNGQINQLLTWANSSYSFGPQVTWQIFSGGRVIATIHLQEAAQIQAYYAYKSTVLTAFQQVESALVALANEQVRRVSLRSSMEANQRATDLSNQLYSEGQTEFLNVLTAERGLYSSQEALALSDQAVTTDLISLFLALGGGWSEFPEKDAVPVGFPQYPYAPPPKTTFDPHPH